jgi:hypothetical protein
MARERNWQGENFMGYVWGCGKVFARQIHVLKGRMEILKRGCFLFYHLDKITSSVLLIT